MLASNLRGRGLYIIAAILIFLTSLIVIGQSLWFQGAAIFSQKNPEDVSDASPSPPEPSPLAPQPLTAPLPPQPPKTESHDDDVDYWTWPDNPRFHRGALIHSIGNPPDICAHFPTHLLSSIQITLKIGATESPSRIDSQFSSVSKCISNLLVASDMDYMVHSHRAFDVLADLPPSLQHDNANFAAYESRKEWFAAGDFSNKAGWRLDKYKFLPMIEYAYASNPTAKWFVFLESDTFMLWPNLFQLLDHYDPTVPLYFGSPSPGRTPKDLPKTWFANGRPGFVISAAGVQKMLDRKTGEYGELVKPRINAQYERELRGECCGDSVVGWALWQRGVSLSGLFPMSNPHPLHGIPFAERYWCQPAVSLHQTLTEDMVPFWEWVMKWNETRPILYADIASYLGLGSLAARDDWDNADWDGWQEPDDSTAHRSLSDCANGCKEHGGCFQLPSIATAVRLYGVLSSGFGGSPRERALMRRGGFMRAGIIRRSRSG